INKVDFDYKKLINNADIEKSMNKIISRQFFQDIDYIEYTYHDALEINSISVLARVLTGHLTIRLVESIPLEIKYNNHLDIKWSPLKRFYFLNNSRYKLRKSINFKNLKRIQVTEFDSYNRSKIVNQLVKKYNYNKNVKPNKIIDYKYEKEYIISEIKKDKNLDLTKLEHQFTKNNLLQYSIFVFGSSSLINELKKILETNEEYFCGLKVSKFQILYIEFTKKSIDIDFISPLLNEFEYFEVKPNISDYIDDKGNRIYIHYYLDFFGNGVNLTLKNKTYMPKINFYKDGFSEFG
ncbi:MAG TPA: hypothetical protein DCY95_12495, partial [Algoriphagus sp.]|nr:hypothetical protein [Algoriphagus sp.]